jgi:excisionase family DNA binding protein
MEKLLTIKEVAEIIGVSVSTIYSRGAGTGTLPRYRFGKRVMFKPKDLERWIESKREPDPIKLVQRNFRLTLPKPRRFGRK